MAATEMKEQLASLIESENIRTESRVRGPVCVPLFPASQSMMSTIYPMEIAHTTNQTLFILLLLACLFSRESVFKLLQAYHWLKATRLRKFELVTVKTQKIALCG